MSEAPGTFDARLADHAGRMGQGEDLVLRHAATVYAEGVVAGLSLAVAALQRRERLIDYLKRWEARLRACLEREHAYSE
ncbi:hypothetical protein KK141_09260 [Dyella sp. LX-66]|uniref:hypothetical protein n=1 Tax=unclassified Dyella TaxID=2634549 RepID=UPI001BDFB740|nr:MULTISPECIES: hypothetical protein [unclassified Dyella]MBT2117203.1 hypothetical protein [Dyella sp. LX-1]MBT2139721.1 hypothetical protein [Dyella sp. LX-66]